MFETLTPVNDMLETQSNVEGRARLNSNMNFEMKNEEQAEFDQSYKRELNNLKEKTLLCKGFLFFILPFTVFSIFGIAYPYVFALVPAHESEICLCSFPATSNNAQTFNLLKTINTVMFFFVNWMFLLALLCINYKIRHVKSNLSIVTEMTIIVAIWIIFCIIQYVCFLLEDVYSCCSANPQ